MGPSGRGFFERRDSRDLAVGFPHIVDEGVLREGSLEPPVSLALALPICTVIEATLRFDFRNGLRVVLGHPAIDIVKKGGIVPETLGVEKMNGKRFANPGDRSTAPAVSLAQLLRGAHQRPSRWLELLVRSVQTGADGRAIRMDTIVAAVDHRGALPRLRDAAGAGKAIHVDGLHVFAKAILQC